MDEASVKILSVYKLTKWGIIRYNIGGIKFLKEINCEKEISKCLVSLGAGAELQLGDSSAGNGANQLVCIDHGQ